MFARWTYTNLSKASCPGPANFLSSSHSLSPSNSCWLPPGGHPPHPPPLPPTGFYQGQLWCRDFKFSFHPSSHCQGPTWSCSKGLGLNSPQAFAPPSWNYGTALGSTTSNSREMESRPVRRWFQGLLWSCSCQWSLFCLGYLLFCLQHSRFSFMYCVL